VRKFVLVHGAWHDAWCWERVIPELQRRGHEAVAVSLPQEQGAGTEAYAAAIDDAITSPTDTTLVAHSASGLVAPMVAKRRGVSELVLVAALMHVPGCTWMEQRQAANFTQHSDFFNEALTRCVVDSMGNWFWRTDDAASAFYNDCERADAIDAARRMRPQDMTVFTEMPPLVSKVEVPTRYILCTQDHAVSRDWAIPTAREQFDATVEEFDAAHSPFWSRPVDFTKLLIGGGHDNPSARLGRHGSTGH
jgi:pimeloyl-ACP methyl ester carboxylesterase